MEALHVAAVKANMEGIFNGVKTPNDGPVLSHLLYADDVLFVGDWSLSNFKNLARFLRCFHLASGLKVNFSKSLLYGVGVTNAEINNMALILSCKPGSFPFTYLGLPVGANMGLVKNWKPIIEKFENKLTLWKARMLSFGGRLTLIEAVLSNLPTYYFSLFSAPLAVIKQLERLRRKFLWGGCLEKNKISWVPWFKVVASKVEGGLGIGSLACTNKALIVKWCLRYKNENTSLWAKSISAFHCGTRRHASIPLNSSIAGVWKSIVNLGRVMHEPVVDVKARMVPYVGVGDKTLFWLDTWVGNRPLRDEFPTLFTLESDKRCFVQQRYKRINESLEWFWGSSVPLSLPEHLDAWSNCSGLLSSALLGPGPDRWLWRTGSSRDTYTVSRLRSELDHINIIPKQNCYLGFTGFRRR
ncbi:uncharacterized protein LOC118491409 [Helianthus annuus]|uniref:uncharacterized protein LOC118491409 n=1 Tax=Helianthus annuus TaxID=4232 RepID=UPI001652E649|nr:uncharacterized protein LOC118491409 [Helianthus annuus]